MKKFINWLFIFMVFFLLSCKKNTGSQGENFTENVNKIKSEIDNDSELLTFFDHEHHPISPAFQPLPTGDNRPRGWLLEIMKEDLNHGIVGALDELYPGIKEDDLYHTARRGGMDDIPEMGDLELTGEAWEASIMWWNAETIGNWWDGFVRHAFLTEDQKSIEQSRAIVENLLASQDDDGYIGIYKKNLRYQHEGSNGELWAQTTAFRMMLAYYEFTKEKKVLDAIERAMTVTMKNYNQGARNPFDLKNAFGGVTHGLMMSDVCETLFRITGKKIYQEYATYLYRAFSTYNINRAFNDVRYPFLLKKEEPFTGHGVHTYEHLRTLLDAYYATGYDELKTAYENALVKLDDCLLPSGAGHAMEWIAGLPAEPTQTAAEFCTMLELRNFFGAAAQKTGDIKFADLAEKLTYNGILGARNDDGTAIAYGKPDNCYKLDGKSLDGHEDEVRYKYSPTHSEPAVCCAPNYTRNFTYFLDQMWGKKEDGLAAILYAPSSLNTTFNGVEINIEEITDYPYSDKIEFKISVAEPIEIALYFRKPAWAKATEINIENAVLENGFYKIKKTWSDVDAVQIEFKNNVLANKLKNGEIYFQKGPLVYALEIPHEEKNIKDYLLKDFHDYHCLAINDDHENLRLDKNALEFEFISGGSQYLKGNVVNTKTNNNREVKLRPMGETVLRRVTFPVQ
ncbi:MAG: beta-L-arabinofuranosidase domain-containing protein [Bacteroidota bacterium]